MAARHSDTVLDARHQADGVFTVTSLSRGQALRHHLCHGWPDTVCLWRRDAAHRLGSLSEPLAAIPVLAWIAVSAPLILTAACLMWTVTTPTRTALAVLLTAAAITPIAAW